MTTMICLVGEQQIPNFLPVRHYRPTDVLFVYTTKTQQKYEYLNVTLKKEANVHGLETDPYDVHMIAKAIDNALEKVSSASQPLLFNLTGGTKMMSLAAYQVAQQRGASLMYLQSEGKQTRAYHYGWKSQQLHLTNDELLPECIKLQDVFDIYLGPGNWKEYGSGRREGSSFEDTIAALLRMHNYEVMVGVQTLGGQVDIDVAVRSGNQYGIIEAKSGKNGKNLDGVKQLNNTVRHLGTYSQTFYVITVPPQLAHRVNY
jgi:hypothetical protein